MELDAEEVTWQSAADRQGRVLMTSAWQHKAMSEVAVDHIIVPVCHKKYRLERQTPEQRGTICHQGHRDRNEGGIAAPQHR